MWQTDREMNTGRQQRPRLRIASRGKDGLNVYNKYGSLQNYRFCRPQNFTFNCSSVTPLTGSATSRSGPWSRQRVGVLRLRRRRSWIHRSLRTTIRRSRNLWPRVECRYRLNDTVTQSIARTSLHLCYSFSITLCVLAFNCQHGLGPAYTCPTTRRLRSSSSPALVVPGTIEGCRWVTDRAFSVAALVHATVCRRVTAASTLSSFRRAMKTHLFTASFPSSL